MVKHSNNKFLYKDEIKTFTVDDLMKSRSPEIESFVASFPSRSRRFLQVIQPRPKEQLFVVSVSHGQHASVLDFLKTILLGDMLMWFTLCDCLRRVHHTFSACEYGLWHLSSLYFPLVLLILWIYLAHVISLSGKFKHCW